MKKAVLFSILIFTNFFKGNGQESRYLCEKNDTLFICSIPSQKLNKIYVLDKKIETNYLPQSFRQNVDTLIFITYDKNQKNDSLFERYRCCINLKTFCISKKEERSEGKLFIPFNSKRNPDSASRFIEFFDEDRLWQYRFEINKSREISNLQIITINGNVYLKSMDNTILLLEHYAQNLTFNSKFNLGYLFPDLSKDSKSFICLDTYYGGLGRWKVRKYYNDSYIVKINIESLKTEPVIKVPKSRISNIRYSPDDRYIYFYSESKNYNYFGNFVYDTIEAKSIRIKRFIMWLK